jgi:TetR/AcrR family transcriptional regulator of autoinduction and epiphytic fitness
MAISDDKRGQILDAAVAEFQERGFAGASMDRIAERANVSKRTVYNHFDSPMTRLGRLSRSCASSAGPKASC